MRTLKILITGTTRDVKGFMGHIPPAADSPATTGESANVIIGHVITRIDDMILDCCGIPAGSGLDYIHHPQALPGIVIIVDSSDSLSVSGAQKLADYCNGAGLPFVIAIPDNGLGDRQSFHAVISKFISLNEIIMSYNTEDEKEVWLVLCVLANLAAENYRHNTG